MTNKLPVVGKRYRLKNYKAEVINVDSEGVTYLQGDKEYWDFLDDFRDYFEELPEDKAETKPETQSHILELSPEVKKAMEELDKELDRWMPTEDKEEYQLTSKAEKLLNALDKQFMSKEEVKIDTRQERVDSVKVNETSESVDVKEEEVKEKESIWRSVSELPEEEFCVGDEFVIAQIKEDRFLVKWREVYQSSEFEKYCTLTDFINDYEKLKERVKKLEEK